MYNVFVLMHWDNFAQMFSRCYWKKVCPEPCWRRFLLAGFLSITWLFPSRSAYVLAYNVARTCETKSSWFTSFLPLSWRASTKDPVLQTASLALGLCQESGALLGLGPSWPFWPAPRPPLRSLIWFLPAIFDLAGPNQLGLQVQMEKIWRLAAFPYSFSG